MRPPGRFATGLVTVSLRAMPPGELRRRYQQELIAELHGLSRGRQVRFALGSAVTAWSLRNATAGRQPMETTMTVVTQKKPLLCRLNMFHKWHVETTPDGDRYTTCARCGKEMDGSAGNWGAGLYSGPGG